MTFREEWGERAIGQYNKVHSKYKSKKNIYKHSAALSVGLAIPPVIISAETFLVTFRRIGTGGGGSSETKPTSTD